MTYAAEKVKAGRLPVTVVELDLDTCSLTYGVAPCTATGSAGDECYNTRKTCQDPDNYTRTTQTIRFVEPVEGLPVGVSMIPCISGVKRAPARITQDFGLGHRASITVSLQDFTHHDRGVDPYVDNRSYDPTAQGTYFGRLLARNPYYQGRTMRIRSGYLGDAWDWNNFQSAEYIIEEIRGPDSAGRVTVIGKDILKLADGKRAQAPVASGGELVSDLDADAVSMGIIGGTYAASGWVRVGDELIEYTGRSGSGTLPDPWILTGLVRIDVTFGSSNAAHDAGDSVQQCLVYQDEPVRDVVEDLLVNFAGVPSGYIVTADWDAEEGLWLSAANVTACLSEPTGVDELIAELQEQCMLRIWWDEVNQEVRFKVMAPPTGVAFDSIDRDAHVIADSVRVKDVAKDRVSQVWFYHHPADYTSEDLGNYRKLYIQADADAEGADQYNESRIYTIKSRWFDDTDLAFIAQTVSRYLGNRRDNPREIAFRLDAKDSSYTVGDVVELTVDELQDPDGSRKATRAIIVQASETEGGSVFDYLALTGIGAGRYGNIGPNSLGDYTAESAANQTAYAFICSDAGLMSNGDEGYSII